MALAGSYLGLSKQLLLIFSAFLLAWLRFGIGGLAMHIWLRKPPSAAPMDAPTKRLLLLESSLGNFLFPICMLFYVSMTSAEAARVIVASIPACVAVMSWLLVRERIDPHVCAGSACASNRIGVASLSKSERFALEIRCPPDDLSYKSDGVGHLFGFCVFLRFAKQRMRYLASCTPAGG